MSGTTVTITGTSSTNVTININYKPESTPTPTPTYGTVKVSPDHGTASPASFSADGTSHTITITPASGYTTTGMTATSTNNDVSVSVSGNTITVTGTSSNNATINVTVPAESTPEDFMPNTGYGEFNAFGRANTTHYVPETNQYELNYGVNDPLHYGDQYVDVLLASLSSFENLTATSTQGKLDEISSKLRFEEKDGSLYNSPETISIFENPTADDPFGATVILDENENVILRISCECSDLTRSLQTETSSLTTGTIEQQFIPGCSKQVTYRVSCVGDGRTPGSLVLSRGPYESYGGNFVVGISAHGGYNDEKTVGRATLTLSGVSVGAHPEVAFIEGDKTTINGNSTISWGDVTWHVKKHGESTDDANVVVGLDSLGQTSVGGGTYIRWDITGLICGERYDITMLHESTNPQQYPSLTTTLTDVEIYPALDALFSLTAKQSDNDNITAGSFTPSGNVTTYNNNIYTSDDGSVTGTLTTIDHTWTVTGATYELKKRIDANNPPYYFEWVTVSGGDETFSITDENEYNASLSLSNLHPNTYYSIYAKLPKKV